MATAQDQCILPCLAISPYKQCKQLYTFYRFLFLGRISFCQYPPGKCYSCPLSGHVCTLYRTIWGLSFPFLSQHYEMINKCFGMRQQKFKSISNFLNFFFNVYLFLGQRETEHKRGRGRERGRHRIGNRLQALSHQPRARRGAWTHGPRDRDLAEVECLTDCATQAPRFL